MSKKFSKSELRRAGDVFGNLENYHCWTDDKITAGDEVTITNSNCEFEFDNKQGVFEQDLMKCYICRLELLETNYSNFVPDKSNNGGKYAFATCKVVEVYDKSY